MGFDLTNLVADLKAVFALDNSRNDAAEGIAEAIDNNYTDDSGTVTSETPTLLNSWVNYHTGTYGALTVTKTAGGVVTIRGLIKSGTITDGTGIFSLGASFRPPVNLIFPIADSAGDVARISISPAGGVGIGGVTSNTWVSITCAYNVN